jgi:hypothetical protein
VAVYAEDPGNESTFDILRAEHCGEGALLAFDTVLQAVNDWGVTELAIYGYSHGASTARLLTHMIQRDPRLAGRRPLIRFTSYVDAVRIPNRSTVFDLFAVSRIEQRVLGDERNTDLGIDPDYAANLCPDPRKCPSRIL